MTGDCHVPFRGSPGVRFPRATRPCRHARPLGRQLHPRAAARSQQRRLGRVHRLLQPARHGPHICALPTGEHCSRGLVCLGYHHAQPKKSAAPTFRRMIASHTRALTKARDTSEPAGQIAAARELEIERLRTALQRADELSPAAGDALEAAAT